MTVATECILTHSMGFFQNVVEQPNKWILIEEKVCLWEEKPEEDAKQWYVELWTRMDRRWPRDNL